VQVDVRRTDDVTAIPTAELEMLVQTLQLQHDGTVTDPAPPGPTED
jgi:hypothetical protein